MQQVLKHMQFLASRRQPLSHGIHCFVKIGNLGVSYFHEFATRSYKENSHIY